MAVLTTSPAVLVAAALIGLAVLLLLIIKFKLHAIISILIGAVVIGVIAGMPLSAIVSCINDGIGNTLKGIALLVGLGSMFGAILEISGGAQSIAIFLTSRFGGQEGCLGAGHHRHDHSDAGVL